MTPRFCYAYSRRDGMRCERWAAVDGDSHYSVVIELDPEWAKNEASIADIKALALAALEKEKAARCT